MIYLSHWLDTQTPGYGGSKTSLKIAPDNCICSGQSSNSLRIEMSNHMGTHIDFPKHFDDHGSSLSDYTARDLVFENPQLIDLPCSPEHLISIADLQGHIHLSTDILLVRTGFEAHRGKDIYWKNNPGWLPETCFWLREKYPVLKAIGFDFISLSSYQHRELGREAHRALLNPFKNLATILIVEDMKLSELKSNFKRVILAPLLIDQADGSPVTVLAE